MPRSVSPEARAAGRTTTRACRATRRALLSAALLSAAALSAGLMALGAAAQAKAPPPPPAALAVGRVPAGEPARIDGRLDESWWAATPALDTFWEVDPGDLAPPPVRTEVRLAADERHLFVSIRAFDPQPQALRGPLRRRDDLGDDVDKVSLFLDTVGDRRVAQLFEISPGGSIADGLFTEGAGSADDVVATLGVEDKSPDLRFRSAVGRFEGGWSAELAIPFSSLRYESGTGKSWALLVARNYPREQAHYLMSSPVTRDSVCTLCWAVPLTDLDAPQQELALQGAASLTYQRSRTGGAGGGDPASTDTRAGIELKVSPRADTHVDLTLRPDFSQVEIDAPQLSGNTRYAIYFPEKRQFFLEGADLLDTPLPVLRTRSLAAPEWGLRLTHRGPLEATAMLVRDGPAGSLLLPEASATEERLRSQHSTALLVRARRHLGQATLGALFSERRNEDALGRNEVSGLDASWSPTSTQQLDVQWLRSRSTALQAERGVPDTGTAWQLRWFHRLPSLSVDASLRRVSAGFRADNGFFESAGVRRMSWSATAFQRPFLGQHEAGLTAQSDRTHGLEGDAPLLYSRRMLGAYVMLPRLTRLVVEPLLHVDQRADTTAPLRQMRRWQLTASSVPTSWWSGVWVQYQGGEMLDIERDRVGRGTLFESWSRWQPLDRLLVQAEFQRLAIGERAPGAYRETTWRWLVLWHLDAGQHLRWIDQQRSVRRDGLLTSEDVARTLSWQRKLGTDWQLDAGLTWQSTSPAPTGGARRGREAFAKLTLEFD